MSFVLSQAVLLCINRNIVECKAACRGIRVPCSAVLIETSWNVKGRKFEYSCMPVRCINRNIVECKEQLRVILGDQNDGINRNIVECKGGHRRGEERIAEVLIETSWNVKYKASEYNFMSKLVLIETSWNVKSYLWQCKPQILRINRNIVECKDRRYCRSYFSGYCINRNIVECKASITSTIVTYAFVLIETSWNVKHTTVEESETVCTVLIETSWNVKKNAYKNYDESRLCINRNIVECKG